ncbi:hypothetical protein EZS27_026248 [termite gut metagenome]|uniref:Uncharacterized protein n=1 Tax=termite gut metagenome TaxID=433724 RepID=A0A5J4QUF3_9ZZZZ
MFVNLRNLIDEVIELMRKISIYRKRSMYLSNKINTMWKEDVERFKIQRKPYLLYEE